MMTPIEKIIITLKALAETAQKYTETHSERDVAMWLLDKLENEVNTLDYELTEGKLSNENT